MQYANGLATQEAIFQVARQLMYEHGYKATTYAMISRMAEAPVGLINYYYKKQDLVARIYGDYLQTIREGIRRQVGHRLENRLQTHILTSHIMLTQIFSDPKTLAFHLEVEAGNLFPQEIHNEVRSRQVQILEDYQVDITQNYYYLCATAEYGARRELLQQNLCLPPGTPEFQGFLNILSTVAVRVAGLSHGVIDENLEKVERLFRGMDYRDVAMFPAKDADLGA